MGIDNPTIFCIDTGTNAGWSLFKDGAITSGIKSFPQLGHEKYGMRFVRFKKWLHDMKETIGDIDALYYEQVHNHTGTQAAHVYGGLIAHLTVFCEHYKIPYSGFGVGKIKKAFTGNGSAKKPMIIEECEKRGHNPQDDNEADAIAIMYLALQTNQIAYKHN